VRPWTTSTLPDLEAAVAGDRTTIHLLRLRRLVVVPTAREPGVVNGEGVERGVAVVAGAAAGEGVVGGVALWPVCER
jgi:hypothetical protein